MGTKAQCFQVNSWPSGAQQVIAYEIDRDLVELTEGVLRYHGQGY